MQCGLSTKDSKADFAQLSVAQRSRPSNETSTLPEFYPDLLPNETLAEILGLSPEDLLEGTKGVSCGTPFTLIPLRSIEALGRVQLNLGAYHQHLAHLSTPHVFAFYQSSLAGVRARMFAPLMGIAEDPATGVLELRPSFKPVCFWPSALCFELCSPSIANCTNCNTVSSR